MDILRDPYREYSKSFGAAGQRQIWTVSPLDVIQPFAVGVSRWGFRGGVSPIPPGDSEAVVRLLLDVLSDANVTVRSTVR